MNATTAPGPAISNGFRWMQLIIGVLCMAMIANLQYGWTLFVNPIDDRFHWGKAAIQVAFTLFVLTETWLVPIEGYLGDRFGPRKVLSVIMTYRTAIAVLTSRAFSFASFWGIRFSLGIGEAGAFPTATVATLVAVCEAQPEVSAALQLRPSITLT